jgi:hypothetical protein
MPIKAKVAADKVARTAVRFVGNPEEMVRSGYWDNFRIARPQSRN